MYLVIFSTQASEDKMRLKAAGLEERTKELLDLLAEDPFADPPAYEESAGNLQNYYSRRINIQHRLVYRIEKKGSGGSGETDRNGTIKPYEGIVYVKRMWTAL